jgi:hypothetical protein
MSSTTRTAIARAVPLSLASDLAIMKAAWLVPVLLFSGATVGVSNSAFVRGSLSVSIFLVAVFVAAPVSVCVHRYDPAEVRLKPDTTY